MMMDDDDDDDDDDDVMMTIAIAAMKPRLTSRTVRPLCALAPSDGFVYIHRGESRETLV